MEFSVSNTWETRSAASVSDDEAAVQKIRLGRDEAHRAMTKNACRLCREDRPGRKKLGNWKISKLKTTKVNYNVTLYSPCA